MSVLQSAPAGQYVLAGQVAWNDGTNESSNTNRKQTAGNAIVSSKRFQRALTASQLLSPLYSSRCFIDLVSRDNLTYRSAYSWKVRRNILSHFRGLGEKFGKLIDQSKDY